MGIINHSLLPTLVLLHHGFLQALGNHFLWSATTCKKLQLILIMSNSVTEMLYEGNSTFCWIIYHGKLVDLALCILIMLVPPPQPSPQTSTTSEP